MSIPLSIPSASLAAMSAPVAPAGGDVEANKQGWMKVLERIRQDPNLAKTLIAFGTDLMQPRPIGQSSGGHFARALQGSVDTFGNLRELDALRQLQAREEERKDTELHHKGRQVDYLGRQVGVQERAEDRALAVQEDDQNYRWKHFEWMKGFKDKELTQQEREAASLNAYRTWSMSNQGNPQVAAVERLAAARVGANPDRYTKEDGSMDRDKAYLDAFDDFSGKAGLPKNRSQFLATATQSFLKGFANNPLADASSFDIGLEAIKMMADYLYPKGGGGGLEDARVLDLRGGANVVPVPGVKYKAIQGQEIGTFLREETRNGRRYWIFRNSKGEENELPLPKGSALGSEGTVQ